MTSAGQDAFKTRSALSESESLALLKSFDAAAGAFALHDGVHVGRLQLPLVVEDDKREPDRYDRQRG